MAISDNFVPNVTDGGLPSLPVPYQVLSGDGAITIAAGVVVITKGTAAAITIADPPTTMNGAQVLIVSATAAAHTVTYTAGFKGTTTSSDVATFGGAKGDAFTIVAYNGAWYATNVNAVTIA